jgi:dihydroxycyclohexadiene carboxylate dehydrogenase
MLDLKAGSIVNVGSNSPRGIYRAPYAAAKGAVFALTTALAVELAGKGIRVNCVAAGPTDVGRRRTPRNPVPPTAEEKAWQQEVFASFERQIPMRRWGTVEEQAAAIAFFASDDASFITGQILSVAGGATVP